MVGKGAFGAVRKTDSVQRGGEQKSGAIDNQRSLHLGRKRLPAFFEFPAIKRSASSSIADAEVSV
jgi:hypothetical protein